MSNPNGIIIIGIEIDIFANEKSDNICLKG
jgi:hypothetical protein